MSICFRKGKVHLIFGGGSMSYFRVKFMLADVMLPAHFPNITDDISRFVKLNLVKNTM